MSDFMSFLMSYSYEQYWVNERNRLLWAHKYFREMLPSLPQLMDLTTAAPVAHYICLVCIEIEETEKSWSVREPSIYSEFLILYTQTKCLPYDKIWQCVSIWSISCVAVYRCPEGFQSMLHPYSNSKYGW